MLSPVRLPQVLQFSLRVSISAHDVSPPLSFRGLVIENPQPANRERKLNAKNPARISFMIWVGPFPYWARTETEVTIIDMQGGYYKASFFNPASKKNFRMKSVFLKWPS
jgi:hypothetical protein